ncbi:chemotaxis protein CheW [Massilia sp. CCM 8733]|uniref:Chemotaxis protein CheW n=1 Tax=Massilia mucilaginosa TaxID=2609282 RepID=A0ABX0NYQ8_9BURK|nr:chemotaxis protein CheW [Massilia mucilaginosa]NHZ91497.1 chemotaxis protein CheW [Massilia mucilaginosa]
MNQLIQNRARAAASAVPAAPAPTQYLTFTLGGETFAIGILGVKEIIEYTSLTDVPMMSDCIRGVINLRGSVVTVMDLSVRFGRPSTPVTKRTCIIIVEIEEDGERQVIGVVVDAVNAVLEIAASDIEPPPAFGAHIRNDYIAGMGKINGRFVILLEIGQVFAGLQTDDAALAAPDQ